MRESMVEDYLRTVVKDFGGEIRKVKWIGRANAPDDRVMLKRAAWCECKATGEVPRPAQLREFNRMREHGEIVYVVDSFNAVDAMVKELLR